jgi:hypothetical protein
MSIRPHYAIAAALVMVLAGSLAPSGTLGAVAPDRATATVTARRPAPKAARATPAPDTFTFRAIGPAASGGRVSAVAGSDRDERLFYVGGGPGGGV